MSEFRPDEHQLRAVRNMCRGSYMLVWDPGVGKTWPVLEAARRCGGSTLAIVPAHLRDQWVDKAREVDPWGEELTPYVLGEDGLDTPIPKEVFANFNFLIASYEFVSHEPRWRQLRGMKWENIAIDECHYLIRQTSTRTQAILGKTPSSRGALVRASKATWLLSGTPFTFPNEIYPIVSRIFPEATRRPPGHQAGFMTAREWENEFCVVETTRFGEKIVDAKNVPDLRRRLNPFLDKVRLGEIHSGGNVTDTIPIRGSLSKLLAGLDSETLALYETLEEIMRDDDIPDEEKLNWLHDHSGLDMAQLRHNIAVAKVAPTAEMVEFELATNPGKIVVYGWHREPMASLAKRLKAPLIYGGMTQKAKDGARDLFANDPRCRVLCGQISAIGTGTDGLQTVARRGIFMEQSWRTLHNKQCIHRLFRRGQPDDTYHSFLSLHGSVDERVARVLKRNAEIISRALD
jgi:hypothetical protein